jgi:hypothetical protein
MLAAACSVTLIASPAKASTLINHGITYDLTAVILSATEAEFTLSISGINNGSIADDQTGRYGVQSFAFGTPAHFASASAPGFTYQAGGLNANGCNGNGAFFCFSRPAPSGPALAANSALSFVFDVSISSGSFLDYNPDFKINWVGTQNNYDLVSLHLAPTFVDAGPELATPLPGALPLFMAGLGAIGLLARRKKKKFAAA